MNGYTHVKSQSKQYENYQSSQINVNEIKHIYKFIVSRSRFGEEFLTLK